MSGRSGQRARLNVELEQRLVREIVDADTKLWALVGELLRHPGPRLDLVNVVGSTDEIDRILIVGTRKRMQRVSAVALKVTALRWRNDEDDEAIVGHERAHWMRARPAISTNRGEEREPNPELIKEVATGLPEIGASRPKLTPMHHGGQSTRSTSKVKWVFAEARLLSPGDTGDPYWSRVG
jgi:hypothetical protein